MPTVMEVVFIMIVMSFFLLMNIILYPVTIEEEKYKPEIVVYELHPLGIYTITHYCPCSLCCGKSDGITATGTLAIENKTIAVDPDTIPLGSIVFIDGKQYVAEDVGGGIKNLRIDIYVPTHQEAINRGVIKREVFIRGEKNGLSVQRKQL